MPKSELPEKSRKYLKQVTQPSAYHSSRKEGYPQEHLCNNKNIFELFYAILDQTYRKKHIVAKVIKNKKTLLGYKEKTFLGYKQ